MTEINARPLLANARQAADDYLMRKVADGSLRPDVAEAMSDIGFHFTTRTLSALRVDGVGEEQITAAYQRQLSTAQANDDQQGVIAAEYSLAVWGGLLADLADYLRANGQ